MKSFNSLQTGKPFRTILSSRPKRSIGRDLCFNSLQTGKPFRTVRQFLLIYMRLHVSIPFKRESPFGQVLKGRDEQVKTEKSFHSLQTGKPFRTNDYDYSEFASEVEFPFPSNGKALSDYWSVKMNKVAQRKFVSIPFKRESPFGPITIMGRTCISGVGFQFPSNGKALSDSNL